jgi:hypothetical protein
MARSNFKKRFTKFLGVDLKSSDINRNEVFASDVLNVQVSKTGGIEKRPGWRAATASLDNGHCIIPYTYYDLNTNLPIVEYVALANNNVYVSGECSLQVAYAGGNTPTHSLYFDGTDYRYQAYENGVSVLSVNLGKGIDEGAPVTVANLATAINGVANWSAVTTGTATIPAACYKLKTVIADDLTESFQFLGWSLISTSYTNPLNTFGSSKEDLLPSWVLLNNVLYITHERFSDTTSNHEGVMKYDGHNMYRAGVDRPLFIETNANNLGPGTNLIGNNYQWIVRFTKVDAQGNIVTGTELKSPIINIPVAGMGDVLIYVGPKFTEEHDIRGARVNGLQSMLSPTPTITVHAGHTMQVGDIAYFMNQDLTGGGMQQREVTAVTATSITLKAPNGYNSGSGNTIVQDGAFISNNFRFEVYRSKASGSTPVAWYLVGEFAWPFDYTLQQMLFTDNTADADLGELFVEPVTTHNRPFASKFISQWKGQLIQANFPLQHVSTPGQAGFNPISTLVDYPTFDGRPQDVMYSDIDSPEYMPEEANGITIELGRSQEISGIAPTYDEFLVFKSQGIAGISGDLAAGRIKVRDIDRDIGCVASGSIANIKEGVFFLDARGPYAMSGNSAPQPIGSSTDAQTGKIFSRISPFFEEAQNYNASNYQIRSSVAVNDVVNNKYILHVPIITSGYQAAGSKTFVYDYSRDAWYIWNNIPCLSGMAQDVDASIIMMSRRFSAFAGSIKSEMIKFESIDNAVAYHDHASAVDASFKSQWEALSEPALLKKFLEMKIYSTLRNADNAAFNLTVATQVDYKTATTYGNVTDAIIAAEPVYNFKLYRSRSRSQRFILSNSTVNQNMNIDGYEVQIEASFKIGFKP